MHTLAVLIQVLAVLVEEIAKDAIAFHQDGLLMKILTDYLSIRVFMHIEKMGSSMHGILKQ